MRPDPDRTRLGRASSLSARVSVYETPVGFEFDLFQHGEVERRRLFFEDIVLVTRHRSAGGLAATVLGLLALCFSALAVYVGRQGGVQAGVILFAASGLPGIGLLVLHLILGEHTVTVFGRRTMGRVAFGWRKKRARRLYEHIRARVATAQGPMSPPGD